ncbi:MAG: hypothetical protein ACE5EQ_11215 [Phycisphaerae bacterium]
MTERGLAANLDSEASIEEAKVHRRRQGFGRRLAIVLGGVVVVVTVVFWNRGVVRRNGCLDALEHFAADARESKLGTVPLELMVAEWRGLSHASVKFAADHYEIISQGWQSTPIADERLPLAVCGTSHATLFGRGRHVLYATREGDVVEWLPEAQAVELLNRARGGQQSPP